MNDLNDLPDNNRRQVVLDTETTGLEPSQGHRIIEIGCVEMVGRRLTRRHFHYYLQPDREIDEGAQAVHGISNEFLADKPRFHDVADEFLDFIRGAELVIHNAPFDVGFLDHELKLLDAPRGQITEYAGVLDTLVLARKMHPGQRNSLDALCKRYQIDNSGRELHGALLDARILADVYLAMTGGQVTLSLGGDAPGANGERSEETPRSLPEGRPPLRVIRPSEAEMQAHQALLEKLSPPAPW
ncbi:MAG: DNA polymerase III subunit epsilon [Thioalkalivibrio sp.]